MATRGVEHQGVVTSLEGGCAVVQITVGGACASCSAKSKCGMSESSSRMITVPLQRGENFAVGQIVSVGVSYKIGGIAILYGYILPLFTLMVLLVSATMAGLNEGVVAGVSLMGLMVYFCGLYLFRDSIGRKITFSIR